MNRLDHARNLLLHIIPMAQEAISYIESYQREASEPQEANDETPETMSPDAMPFVGEARPMREDDYLVAANLLSVDTATIKAVAEVESNGSGFLADGRPRILYEAHVFGRLTDHQWTVTHPDISSKRWNRALYGKGGAHQYERLEAALALDEVAALKSCSWGMFQVMGFNYKVAGHDNVHNFVSAMMESEGEHLMAMVKFCINNQLKPALRQRDWATFARKYNGPGYKINRYDIKLAAAYRKYSEES